MFLAGEEVQVAQIYVYVGVFFNGRKDLQPHNIFFSFLFFCPKFLHMLSVIRTVSVSESLSRNIFISCPGFCLNDKRHILWLCQAVSDPITVSVGMLQPACVSYGADRPGSLQNISGFFG